jgi:hypothetical protein
VTEEIKILPSVRRLIHTKLAQFATETRGSDLYHFMQAFEILRSNVGDEPLKEHYGDNYDQLKNQLKVLNIRLNKVKLYYDSIQNFDERLKELNLKKLFNNEFENMPLISRPMFKSFELLLNKTEIKFMPIPRECFKTVEKEQKSLDVSEGDKKDAD